MNAPTDGVGQEEERREAPKRWTGSVIEGIIARAAAARASQDFWRFRRLVAWQHGERASESGKCILEGVFGGCRAVQALARPGTPGG